MRQVIIHGTTQKEHAKKIIDELPDGGKFEVRIQAYRKPRSTDQNALMWKWFEIIGNDIGDSKKGVHDDLVGQLLGYDERVSRITGEVRKDLKETSALSKAEFSRFLDDVYRWALNDMNIILPLPEDRYADRER